MPATFSAVAKVPQPIFTPGDGDRILMLDGFSKDKVVTLGAISGSLGWLEETKLPYKLAEVAHYAPPGIPMIQLGPDRTEWFHYIIGQLERNLGPNITDRGADVLREILAEVN